MQHLTVRLPDRRMFIGVAIGVLVGVIGVGAVSAASPAPTGPSSTTGTGGGAAGTTGPSGTAASKPGIRLGLVRQAVHGNFRVAVDATNRNGIQHVLYVRGTLKVSAGSVTVTLPDSSTQTFTVDSSTKVRAKGTTEPFSALADGDRAMVFGTKNDDGSYTAKLIRCVKEPKAAAAAASAAPAATP